MLVAILIGCTILFAGALTMHLLGKTAQLKALVLALLRVVWFVVACAGSGFLLHWLISGFAGHSVGAVQHWIVLCFVLGFGYVWYKFKKWASLHY